MNSNVMQFAAESAAPAAPSLSNNSLDMVLDLATIQAINMIAETMAGGKVAIPTHLQGKKADCFAVAMQAFQWRMNPFAVAQKTHISQGGQLGYEAQLINAVVCNLAPITARPDYEFLGDWSKVLGKVEERKSEKSGGKYYVATYTKKDEEGLGVIIRATLRGESTPREVTMMMSQAYPRFSTQWATDPQQQICYLAIRKWARRYTPDVLLGVYTPDELNVERPESIDMGRAEEVRKTDEKATSKTDSLRSRMSGKRTGATPAEAPNADAMIRAIDAATTGHELKVAIARIEELADDAERERVRTAYQAKIRTEKERSQQARAEQAQAAQQQPDLVDTAGAPEITQAQLLERFANTSDVDVLDADATLIGQLPEPEQQEAINAYNARRARLEGE